MHLSWSSDDKSVQLYQGNCIDFTFPKESIVITDPPYNIGQPKLIKGWKDDHKSEKRTVGNDFGQDFDILALEPKDWVGCMPDTVICFYGAKRMENLLKTFRKGGYACHQLREIAEIVQDFHWCKPNPPPTMRAIGLRWGVESGYVFRKKGTKHLVNKKIVSLPNFMVKSHGISLEHTTQKPLSVMKWLIRQFSVEGSLVVDPFMGSGVVGVGCIELGRKFIGIEQKKEYVELSKKLISNAVNKKSCGFGFNF